MFNQKAKAIIKGGKKYPKIEGTVEFTQTKKGVIVTAQIYNLPTNNNKCGSNVLGFHIHKGRLCSGNEIDEFANALTHYNPNDCMHPYHAGDLPPLFENNGYAYMKILTDRFKVEDIIGRVIIIHDKPDDFTTQPSGNSGEKIACGKIKKA